MTLERTGIGGIVASADAWLDTEDAIETADATAIVVVAFCDGVKTSSRGARGFEDKVALEAGTKVVRMIRRRNILKTACRGRDKNGRERYPDKG